MAIKLSKTPQQQKASFSAFDTSSNFKSGLTNVGQALRGVGAGQQRMKQRQEMEADAAQRDAKAAQAEIDRKTKANQKLTALEIEAKYAEDLTQVQTELARASKIGDPNALKAAQEKLNALDTNSAGFSINNFAQGNAELVDSDVIRESSVAIRKLYTNVARKSEIDRINSESYTRSKAFLDRSDITATNFVNNNSSGVSNEVLIEELNGIIGDPYLAPIRESTSIGQARAAFDKRIKQQLVDRMINQFDHTNPLTPDEVNSRMEAIRGVLDDQKFQEANVIFDVDDEEAITNAYETKIKEVSASGFQQAQAKIAQASARSALSLALDADVITPEIIYNAIQPLGNVDTSVLNPEQSVKHNSQLQLAFMFTDGEEPLAYSMLQSMSKKPFSDKTTLSTQLEEEFGSNFVNIGLAPTEKQMLSDWLHSTLSKLQDIGDNPSNIRLLSPYHAQLVERGRTDPTAYLEAKREYTKFVKESPNLNRFVSPNFYINSAEFPTTDMGNETTFIEAVMTNFTTNGVESTLGHASYRLDQGGIRGLELLRFESEKLAADTFTRTGNPDIAKEAVTTLVANYKSGGEPDSVVDELLNTIIREDIKFDRDKPGNVIPLITLSSLHEDSLDPSKKPFYDRILRGYVKLHKGELVRLDDPEEQHEWIRDQVFKDKNVFTLVASTGTGSLIELPAEFNNFIDESKDRAGLFKRAFFPFGNMLSNTESIKAVSSVYVAAVVSEMISQNSSLDIEKRLRTVVEEMGGPTLGKSEFYGGGSVGSDALMGYTGGVSEATMTRRTRRAFLVGLMNIKHEGKPLAKIVTKLIPDANGKMQKHAVLKILNRQFKYVEIAKSEEDRSPITAPIAIPMSVVEKVMPELTGIPEDSLMGDVPFFNSMYVPQFFGMEEGVLYNKSFRRYDEIYPNEVEED